MSEQNPATTAAVDQARAELVNLVRIVREHQADCEWTDASCPGRAGIDRITDLDCVDRDQVLVLALGELARGDYRRADS